MFNLIDTPGHVDFSYEVSRSIAACEGALTWWSMLRRVFRHKPFQFVFGFKTTWKSFLLNKVDLPSANPEEVTDDIVDLLGCQAEEVIHCSAKTGLGIESILEAIVARIPSPEGNNHAPLQALIFDSVYNPFRGVETYFRVMNGQITKGDRIKFIATEKVQRR